ncbi:MAG: class I SAM-dependent methyltransferase [Vitreoscilla sp.]
MSHAKTLPAYIPETAFGDWFLQTPTWDVHVLEVALRDLEPMMPARRASYPVVVDVGCGWGGSLRKLNERFKPERLIGFDIAPKMVEAATREAAQVRTAGGGTAEVVTADSAALPLPDASVDLLFCHQTFHHLVDQDAAIAEFFRVLKPGGTLLFAESTRRYIHSWIIRLLFRHPMEVQKTAPEYLALVRAAGFVVPDSQVSYPFLWWSREDLGLVERVLRIKPPAEREETLINLVATRP